MSSTELCYFCQVNLRLLCTQLERSKYCFKLNIQNYLVLGLEKTNFDFIQFNYYVGFCNYFEISREKRKLKNSTLVTSHNVWRRNLLHVNTYYVITYYILGYRPNNVFSIVLTASDTWIHHNTYVFYKVHLYIVYNLSARVLTQQHSTRSAALHCGNQENC